MFDLNALYAGQQQREGIRIFRFRLPHYGTV